MANQYTDEFIQSQKKKLLQDKTTIQKRIQELQSDDTFADTERTNDNAATDTDAREQQYHQDVEAQINDLKKSLAEIEHALDKIEKGRYGRCEKCDAVIPQARLELVPESRYCMDCEKKLHA